MIINLFLKSNWLTTAVTNKIPALQLINNEAGKMKDFLTSAYLKKTRALVDFQKSETKKYPPSQSQNSNRGEISENAPR
jgi:hypothetical protein